MVLKHRRHIMFMFGLALLLVGFCAQGVYAKETLANADGEDAVTLTMGEVRFEAADAKTVTVSWDAVEGANAYVVHYNGDDFLVKDALKYKLTYAYAHEVVVKAVVLDETDTIVSESQHVMVENVSNFKKKINKDDFLLTNDDSLNSNIRFAAKYSGTGFEVRVEDLKGKKKLSGTVEAVNGDYKYEYLNINGKIKVNTAYQYKVRPYIKFTSGKVVKGDWSAYRYYYCPGIYNLTFDTKVGQIRFLWKKGLPGVTKLKFAISDKREAGYKNCGTVPVGKKSITIKKYGKKKIQSGKYYYFMITYYIKAGKKTYVSDPLRYGIHAR